MQRDALSAGSGIAIDGYPCGMGRHIHCMPRCASSGKDTRPCCQCFVSPAAGNAGERRCHFWGSEGLCIQVSATWNGYRRCLNQILEQGLQQGRTRKARHLPCRYSMSAGMLMSRKLTWNADGVGEERVHDSWRDLGAGEVGEGEDAGGVGGAVLGAVHEGPTLVPLAHRGIAERVQARHHLGARLRERPPAHHRGKLGWFRATLCSLCFLLSCRVSKGYPLLTAAFRKGARARRHLGTRLRGRQPSTATTAQVG